MLLLNLKCKLGEQSEKEPNKMQVFPTPGFEENPLNCAVSYVKKILTTI